MKVSGLLALLLLPLGSGAQDLPQSGPATITFHFVWPARDASDYAFVIDTDGSTRLTGIVVDGKKPERITLATKISPTTAARMFAAAESLSRFNSRCASKAKVADTGTKTLSYQGPLGTGTCTYNYTESKAVQGLTDTFLGMALTLSEGRRLEFDHRFDRLSLDVEMNALSDAARDGRAVEFGMIAGTLRSIADDPDVLERVRAKATTLLKLGQS